jgi:hypothetical protein
MQLTLPAGAPASFWPLIHGECSGIFRGIVCFPEVGPCVVAIVAQDLARLNGLISGHEVRKDENAGQNL